MVAVLVHIRQFYERVLPRRQLAWLWIALAAALYGACLYALARDLLSQLGAADVRGVLFSAVLGKLVQPVWIGLILMLVAGADNDPFRVLAHTYRLAAIAFAVALPLCFLFAPTVLINPSTPPLSTEIQDALNRLASSPAQTVFRLSVAGVLAAQLWMARTGLEVAGARRRDATLAVVIAALVYLFLNVVGLDRIDLPPPPPSNG